MLCFDKFTVNFQNTIDNEITPKVGKQCKRDDVVDTTLKGRCIKLSLQLIIEMSNLKVAERGSLPPRIIGFFL